MIDRLNAASVAWIAVLVLAVCGGAVHAESVIHVNGTAPDGGDGTAWESAFNDLHDALAAAVPGDDLWIVAGVYTPAEAGGWRDASFMFGGGIRLFGGFAGDEVERAERDWIANETILSGDLDGDDEPGFANMDDNSHHVVIVQGGAGSAMLNGLTIAGGNALDDSPPDYWGGGVLAEAVALAVRHCTFVANQAEHGGGIAIGNAPLELSDCTFRKNEAGTGGGVDFRGGGTMIVTGCSFLDNLGDVGTGFFASELESLTVSGGNFVGNDGAGGAGGGASVLCDTASFDRCVFKDNFSFVAGGLMLSADVNSITNCLFASNSAVTLGGNIVVGGETTMINCVISRGSADRGGGIYNAGSLSLINCTLSRNEGNGINREGSGAVTMTNTILWGNVPEQYADMFGQYAYNCDIEGGWQWVGSNNIDADPLFVQAGADDLRLSFGSPCLDAGDNAAVPPEVETDLGGEDRIQNGVVDIGAYEGPHDLMPPAAVASDIDPGDVEFLVPEGTGFDPETYDTVIVRNFTGADDASMSVTVLAGDGFTGAAGFSVPGTVLDIETTMSDGEHKINVFMPFVEEDLGGANPLELDVTYLDESADTWALAVSGNTANSPGHPRPMGDRIVVEGPGNWGTSNALGDWGVYWDPDAGSGFVWANVDFAAMFAFGVPLCPADVVQPPDGSVDFDDLRALLFAWGEGLGPYDVDNDGVVDVIDLLLLLDSWGGCP